MNYTIDGRSLENAIQSFFKIFTRNSEGNVSLQAVLAAVGRYYQADRAYLFEVDLEKRTTSNTYEWCEDGVGKEIDNLQNIPLPVMSYWSYLFKENGFCSILCDKEYARKDPEVFQILEPQGIDALLVAPITVAGDVVAFMGVDNPRDHVQEISFITTVAHTFYSQVLYERERRNLKIINELENKVEEVLYRSSATQINSHFLYNALTSIREIILFDPEAASELVYDFTIHLRAAINLTADSKPIIFSEELKNIRAYLSIEKVRLGDRLKLIYDIEDEDFYIEPISIQPIVENSVKHGIRHLVDRTGILEIRSRKIDMGHEIIIKDNGVGFDLPRVLDECEQGVRDSHGLMNIMRRLEFVGASVDICSKEGEGTTTTIRVPDIKQE